MITFGILVASCVNTGIIKNVTGDSEWRLGISFLLYWWNRDINVLPNLAQTAPLQNSLLPPNHTWRLLIVCHL